MPVDLLVVMTKDRPLSIVPIYVDYYTDLVSEARVPWAVPAYNSGKERFRGSL